MSTPFNDGGSAFPRPGMSANWAEGQFAQTGMTCATTSRAKPWLACWPTSVFMILRSFKWLAIVTIMPTLC